MRKTINNVDVVGYDKVSLRTPPVKCDVEIVTGVDVAGRDSGAVIELIVLNIGGTVRFTGNENFLINELQENVIPVLKKAILLGINSLGGANVYYMDTAVIESMVSMVQMQQGIKNNAIAITGKQDEIVTSMYDLEGTSAGSTVLEVVRAMQENTFATFDMFVTTVDIWPVANKGLSVFANRHGSWATVTVNTVAESVDEEVRTFVKTFKDVDSASYVETPWKESTMSTKITSGTDVPTSVAANEIYFRF